MFKLNKLFLFLILFAYNFAGLAKVKEIKKPTVEIAKVPIIYHDNYDIACWGIEKLHPFDTKKYSKIANSLLTTFHLNQHQLFSPEKISDQDLLLVHTQEYLDSLKTSSNVAKIAEVPAIAYAPNFMLQKYLLDPMRYATAGTVLGAELALTHKWAINLSGGYHHAKSDSGGGFCFFADIPLAVKKIRAKHPSLKVLVIDLDAHQGNGHEAILSSDKLTSIFDIYNQYNYPYDIEVQKTIDFNHPVSTWIEDKEYLELLKKTLPQALESPKPDLIIYNAGTDVYKKDPLGKMSISKQGIVDRDLFVFSQAFEKNIPLLMVLSGGYSPESAEIITNSIAQVLHKIMKLTLNQKFYGAL